MTTETPAYTCPYLAGAGEVADPQAAEQVGRFAVGLLLVGIPTVVISTVVGGGRWPDRKGAWTIAWAAALRALERDVIMHHNYAMRTTIDLAPHLLAAAKRLAADRQTSLTEVLEDSLRSYLASERNQRRAAASELRLPTVRGSRLKKGVNLNDTSALLDDA